MRLKATIENVITFTRIIQSIEKQSKSCIMRFAPTTLQIICASENEGGVQVWSQIKVSTLFKDFVIQSNSDNEVTCELQTEPLLQALRSASASGEITMTLAKRGDVAFFRFDMQIQSRQGKNMEITHDVRLKILRVSEVQAIKEPLCPEPDIYIILPPMAKMRTVIERMGKLSSVIGFSANDEGTLRVEIATEALAVDTTWKNCPLPKMTGEERQEAQDDDEEEEPNRMHAVLIAIRSLQRFLASTVVSTTTIACICSGHCLILYVYIGDVDDSGGVLTFYIPSRTDDVPD